MDTKQLVLQRVLEAADEPLKVDSLDDRMRLQKAVYLLQAAGVPLGYPYSWYLKGPYSTKLTQDYFGIVEAQRLGDEVDRRMLNPELQQKVKQVAKRLFSKPGSVTLKKPQWFELLASVHYLVDDEKKSLEEARAVIRRTKPHLNNFFDAGATHLRQHGLLTQ